MQTLYCGDFSSHLNVIACSIWPPPDTRFFFPLQPSTHNKLLLIKSIYSCTHARKHSHLTHRVVAIMHFVVSCLRGTPNLLYVSFWIWDALNNNNASWLQHTHTLIQMEVKSYFSVFVLRIRVSIQKKQTCFSVAVFINPVYSMYIYEGIHCWLKTSNFVWESNFETKPSLQLPASLLWHWGKKRVFRKCKK